METELADKANTTDIPDVSDFITASDLPDTSSFITSADLPDTSSFITSADLPDTSSFITSADLPDTSSFITDQTSTLANYDTSTEVDTKISNASGGSSAFNTNGNKVYKSASDAFLG